MRGEFIRADGLVLPNMVSLAGGAAILAAWAKNTVPQFYFGLVKGVSTPTMTLAEMHEPTVGTNGYARIAVARDATGWPVTGIAGAESYIETKSLVFTAVGGNFDQVITRIALFNTNTPAPTNNVMALSAAFPNDVTIGVATPAPDRTFKYRLYL